MPSFKDKFTNIFKKNEPDDDDDEALLASDTLTATASRQANNFVSGAKSFMGIQDEEAQREPPGMMEELQQEMGDCFQLTKKQRLYGFGICFALGTIMSMLSTLTLITGKLVSFAVLYSFGNVVSFMSSFFLIGPMAQLKTMFSETRWIAATIAICSIALTLMAAFWWKIPVIVLVFVIIEMLAMLWYMLSFIPYGRRAAQKCVESCMSSSE